MRLFLILKLLFSIHLVCCSQNLSTKATTDSSGSEAIPLFYGTRITLENDWSPFAFVKDEYYTGGGKLDLLTNDLQFLRLIFFNREWGIQLQNVSAGVAVFTPRKLDSPLDSTDRPWANFEFISIGSSFLKKKTFDRIFGYELFLGWIGNKTAGNFQKDVHECIKSTIPEGWPNQIGKGGSFAANFRTYEERNLYERPNSKGMSKFQASFAWEVNVGNYLSNVSAGFRLNVLNKNWGFGTNLPGSSRIITKDGKKQLVPSEEKCIFNFYLNPRLRLVGHNATLTGKLLSKESKYTLKPTDVRRILGEFESGFNLKYGRSFIGSNLNIRTSEFRLQKSSWNYWASIYFAYIRQYRKK